MEPLNGLNWEAWEVLSLIPLLRNNYFECSESNLTLITVNVPVTVVK